MLLLILYFSTVVDGRERRLLSQQLQRRFHLKELVLITSSQISLGVQSFSRLGSQQTSCLEPSDHFSGCFSVLNPVSAASAVQQNAATLFHCDFTWVNCSFKLKRFTVVCPVFLCHIYKVQSILAGRLNHMHKPDPYTLPLHHQNTDDLL